MSSNKADGISIQNQSLSNINIANNMIPRPETAGTVF